MYIKTNALTLVYPDGEKERTILDNLNLTNHLNSYHHLLYYLIR